MPALAQKIVFGSVTNPILTLTERSVDAESISAVLSAAVVGDEIAVDEMTATADNAAFTIFADNLLDITGKQLVSSDNYQLSVRVNQNIEKILPNLPTGTALWYYADNSLVGKFYVKNIKRLDKLRWRIKAQSIVGVLDGLQYMGQMCSGETFEAVIADILGNTTPFTVSPELAGLAVFGHFPIMSRRAALHWLLFAKGANLFKDSNGDPYFDFLSAKADNISLPKNLVFYGDTIEQDVAASRAEITEHTYLKLASTERITLFDNTDGRGTANFETVTFGEPVYDLWATDTLTITESGCNYAVISGVGVLTGVPYIHTNRIVAAGKSDSKLRTCSVTDVTIISLVESINVANRVLAYYRYGKKTHADFVRNTEKPTDILNYTNSWGEPEQGYIAGMELKTSSLQRATVDLISGYTPTGEGNNYNYSTILTGTGVWYPPTGTKRVRAVLISGGQGGQGGWYGENGTDGGNNGHGEGGNGGAGGQSGSGGRITLADFESDGSAIPYATGTGGIGGAGGIRSGNTTTAPTLGAQGEDTTFGNYTTANGNLAPNGIANIFSGVVYALPGSIGLSGKKGGKTNEYAAEDYPPNTGGQQGKTNTLDSEGLVAYGGGGGGAAFGSNGEDGYPGGFSQTTIEGTPQPVIVGGKGGKGATPNAAPDAPASTEFGRGGTGGYGGGGGGGGAAGSHILFSGNGGAGGNGSDGGTGAPGCIILYY